MMVENNRLDVRDTDAVISSESAMADYAEWALFREGTLLVKIDVYADESGTHGMAGSQPGAEVVLIGGYAGYREDWTMFCGQWQSVLNKYEAKYFHFSEWAMASAIVRNKTRTNSRYHNGPYFGWDLEKLDGFKDEMARIAGVCESGLSRFPFAQSFHVDGYRSSATRDDLKNLGLLDSRIDFLGLVYVACFHGFFDLFRKDLAFTCPILTALLSSFLTTMKMNHGGWRRIKCLHISEERIPGFAESVLNPKMRFFHSKRLT